MAEGLVKIGNSDVVSTPMGLGANAVGGTNLFPNLKDDTGIEIVKTALANGIDMIDTAYAYGLGHSEELIGQALKGVTRADVVIADKAAQNPKLGPNGIDNSPAFLTQAVEDALKRLNTNYIDIFYIHFPDQKTPKNEAVEALYKLKQAGKIRAIGVSNFNLEQLKEANKDGHVDIFEGEYNLLHREAEKELFPYLKQNNIAFVPYFPLASGLLTGKYIKPVTFPEDDLRHSDPDFQGERFKNIVDQVNLMQPIADKHHATIAQIVLAWYMMNPNISVVIPGAKKPEQVKSNAQAMKIELSQNEYDHIDQLFK
ncbi:aldo keto reductase [Lactobacillus selangorensis]|uniref:Aldo keto reductase n=1 Tax=Lactobacillus selangorensis TaxID=81857 RepID=A0A0R2FXJ2_9LACO|nr:aldo/keto reductase [Lactobacillus selangorensis]KRN29059.1 aldo keto reductase [Lactobacillus selangorensis]KRN30028.1 aldo keto reductase [Lactobacillus selangorensis]